MPAITELASTPVRSRSDPTGSEPAGATSSSSSGGPGRQRDPGRGRADFMRRFYLSRLHVHLVLLLLVAFVPTAGLLLRTTLEQHREATSLARQDALRWARVLAGEHERTIETARELLTMLAQLPDVRQQRPDRCNELARDLLRRYPRYTNLGAVTLNGSVFCSAVPPAGPIDLPGRAHFWRAVESGGFEVGEYQIDGVTGRTTVTVSSPLIDDTGAVQGAVFAAVDLTWFTQLPALVRLPAGSTLTISDRQGRVRLRAPDPARWAGQVAWDKGVADRMVGLGEGSAEVAGPDGASGFVGFTSLPSAEGGDRSYLAVAIPHAAALAAPAGALARNLIVLGLIAALALVAARLIDNRVIPRDMGALGGAPTPLGAGGRGADAAAQTSGTGERLGPPPDDAPAVSEAHGLPAGSARARPEPHPDRRRAPERRQYPRDPVSWPVRMWLHAGGAAVGRVVDASANGLRVVVAGAGWSELLELGGCYRVEVLPPGMKRGFIRVGELRHVGDRTIGLSLEEELPRAALPREPAARRFLARIAEGQRRGAA